MDCKLSQIYHGVFNILDDKDLTLNKRLEYLRIKSTLRKQASGVADRPLAPKSVKPIKRTTID